MVKSITITVAINVMLRHMESNCQDCGRHVSECGMLWKYPIRRKIKHLCASCRKIRREEYHKNQTLIFSSH